MSNHPYKTEVSANNIVCGVLYAQPQKVTIGWLVTLIYICIDKYETAYRIEVCLFLLQTEVEKNEKVKKMPKFVNINFLLTLTYVLWKYIKNKKRNGKGLYKSRIIDVIFWLIEGCTV